MCTCVCECVCASVCVCMWGGQRTTVRSWFSPSTLLRQALSSCVCWSTVHSRLPDPQALSLGSRLKFQYHCGSAGISETCYCIWLFPWVSTFYLCLRNQIKRLRLLDLHTKCFTHPGPLNSILNSRHEKHMES